MTSAIDATKPAGPTAYTADMRANFQAAADEISLLQAAMDAMPPYLPLDGSQPMTGTLVLFGNGGLTTDTTGTLHGAIDLNTPNSTDGHTTGELYMWTGQNGLGPGDGGGYVATGNIGFGTGNATGGNNGVSGLVEIWTGTTDSGNSGEIQIYTGNAGGASTQSGDISLKTGASNGTRGSIILDAPTVRLTGHLATQNTSFAMQTPDTDDGTMTGTMQIWSGNTQGGGNTGIAGIGTGDVNNSNGNTGTVWLWSGNALGGGDSGDINLATGTSDLGTRGTIVLDGPVGIVSLPTADPASAGKLWIDPAAGFALKVSQG